MTTEVTTGARSETLTAEQRASLRYAMLSVYYRSLGSQLESRGAPVIAVPPEVRPLSLEEALHRIKEEFPTRLWDAYWRIVRSVPVEGWHERPADRRYPRAFVNCIDPEQLEALDVRRRRSRAGARAFAAALQACAERQWPEAEQLADRVEGQAGSKDDPPFTDMSQSLLGMTAGAFLRWVLRDEQRKARIWEELRKLEEEVGLNLSEFVEDFADAVAFANFREQCGARPTMLTSSSVIRQNANTLTTTATVTALVENKFNVLVNALDPLGWSKCSDVIEKTEYLKDPFDLTSRRDDTRLGQGFGDCRFLFEQVGINWGNDEDQIAEFRNVLAIDKFSVHPDLKSITVPFRLCRSIDSRILWDQRAGGILVDGGSIVARPVGPGRWRLTTRKVLRFSDRTPYSNAPGWRDFGQMLNYLAPASVTWWLETEMHSAECLGYTDDAPALAAVQQTEGSG